MTEPARIDPDAFYDDGALHFELGLAFGAIAKARKTGDLRSTKRGGRVLYLGRWVQEWLTGDIGKPASAGAVAVAS